MGNALIGLLYLACPVICVVLARKYGLSAGLAFFLGVISGPIGVVLTLILGRKQVAEVERRRASMPTPDSAGPTPDSAGP